MADEVKTDKSHDDELADTTEEKSQGSQEATLESKDASEQQEPVSVRERVEVEEDGETEDDDVDEESESEDSLTFSNGVIEKIVAIAMRDVPGVIGMRGGWINRVQDAFGATDPRKGVTVEVTPDSAVRVNISVLIEYGSYAPQVFEDVKKAVVSQVTGMTGLTVAGVNLRIVDVLTADEIAAKSGQASDQAPSDNDASNEADVEDTASVEDAEA